MPTAHIFCSVIDNFGDLGVCWRLARQLSTEHGAHVILLVDDLVAFQQLDSRINPELAVQPLDELTLMRWNSHEALALMPAELVIEGFACALPDNYRAQLTAKNIWINLDYLSAESWIEDCHGLSSPQSYGANTTFWFPGFTPSSGGLLRENALLQRLDDPEHTFRFWQRLDLPQTTVDTPRLSLFCYETDSVSALLEALHESKTELMICTGKALCAINKLLAEPLTAGNCVHHGASTLFALPMLSHNDYDQLLAACDLNIIRGEDSFIRAQWAAKPLLWHIYPQDELAHETKLAAWLARVEATISSDATTANAQFLTHTAQSIWRSAQWAWVRNKLTPKHIHELLAELQPLSAMMQRWREHLMQQPDLATQLMRFYANKVESPPKKTHPDKPL